MSASSRTASFSSSLWLALAFCVGDKSNIVRRTREAGARAAGAPDDPDDEFGEEAAFLNLDDVLEGADNGGMLARKNFGA